ncbi:TonB-dependent receptor [Shewanella corallii]|uniref:TonB-dependent receptor n=1 Tax=Shewanella corallii TaxID=560080 RepID=A0ABT0NC51_9GAMM|nr:TonB-dependent receptor [Shewanella corallii]MCL2915680.1 TonB-dependent receptor [Shewanella corallii]
MSKQTAVAKAVRFSMFAIASSAVSSGATIAQESAGADVERIEVTGSRIQRTDMETASPVTTIDAASIQATGATSIDEVLQKMTSAGGAMTNPAVNNGSLGNASINLRGLGSQRTLVLVNSRRMVNSGTGAAARVDLNTIPVSMIKRIEVLKDGASAVYGTDAVAGVVNIILKDDFEGLEMNLQTGVSGHGDGEEVSFDITMGGSFDRGNVVMGIQYMDRGGVGQGDRDFSACPYAERTNAQGELELYCAGSVYSEFGHIYNGSDKNVTDLQGSASGEWKEFEDSDRYNYAPSSFLYTPMQRLNITALGNYELTDDINLFAEAMHTKRWSSQSMAPQPIYTSFDYDVATMGDALVSHGYKDGDEIAYYRRMSDVGDRLFSQVVDTSRVVLGLEGYLDSGFQWDASINYGRNDSVEHLENLVNMGSVNEAIEAGTFNPLQQSSWQGESINEFVYTELNSGGSEMFIASANIAGELYELPAGYLGIAAGVEHRKDKAWFVPDSLTSQGLANDPKVEPTQGEFDVNEAYVELAVPLLADLPGAQQVDLSAAMRFFDYSTFGSDSTWKLGLTWRVYDDLMFRGVASTAFRAPTVNELFSGESPSMDMITHPVAQEQAVTIRGGNPNLTPEEADIMTLGMVYSPSWLDGMSLTVDYYDIEVTNAIALVDSQYIVDQCVDAQGNLINQGSALCQSAAVEMLPGNRLQFNNQLQNIGAEKTAGIDVNLAYSFDAAGIDWRTSVDSTFLLKNEVTVTGDTVDYTGLITKLSGGYARNKTNMEVMAQGESWSAAYNVRFISGMDDYSFVSKPEEALAPSTGSVFYHDVSASYYLPKGWKVTAGVKNLFDKEPPYYTGYNDSNTDPYSFDTMGRYFYLQFNLSM